MPVSFAIAFGFLYLTAWAGMARGLGANVPAPVPCPVAVWRR